MTPQQKRKFTLALHRYLHVKKRIVLRDWANVSGVTTMVRYKQKLEREEKRLHRHLYQVVDDLMKQSIKIKLNGLYGRIGKKNRCTCPASVDITFSGHLPGCPEGGI